MLRTKTKLRIARILNRLIVGPRRFIGKASTVRASRQGVNWQLDLNEGIDLAIYLGRYQSLPQRVVEEWVRPNSVLIDIGANVGAFTLPMLQYVGEKGRVISVEPTDYAFNKLMINLQLNPGLALRSLPVQAGLNASGAAGAAESSFYSRWPLHSVGTVRHSGHEGVAETASRAKFFTLDSLLAEFRVQNRFEGLLSFVKLDADGNELTVLQGARRTFMTERPAMYIEIAPYIQDELPGRFEELLSLLTEFGYRLEDATTGRELPSSASELRRQISFGASIDVLARPI